MTRRRVARECHSLDPACPPAWASALSRVVNPLSGVNAEVSGSIVEESGVQTGFIECCVQGVVAVELEPMYCAFPETKINWFLKVQTSQQSHLILWTWTSLSPLFSGLTPEHQPISLFQSAWTSRQTTTHHG